VTDLDALWLARLQEIVDRAAHEVKDALNGVVLNVEVTRSRSSKPDLAAVALGPFAEAASAQLEALTQRVEAVLFLARPQRGGVDVGVTLRHLAHLLVPAARADGGALVVEGESQSAPTTAPAAAVRLALASGLIAATPRGSTGRCVLERVSSGLDTVVRFSHESAGACSLDPATAAALAGHAIRIERSDEDLVVVFPR
jgi:signal transduction histidine kinase